MKTLEEQLASALDAADLHGVITLETLSSLIAAQNLDMPAGYVYDENGNGIIVTVGDAIADGEDLENLVLLDLGIEGLDPIRVCDVADVVRADNAGEIYASLNGNNGLILMFSKQSNYATAKVSDNINAAFEELSAQYPGLTFTALMDQGDYIYLLRDSILSSLLWGALFSVVILFLFLRDWRPTVITLCSIPISLLFALTLMYFTGVSINIMSLSGLSISVGMLVDNSVVVIENTYRLRALGESTVKSAVSGARQVGRRNRGLHAHDHLRLCPDRVRRGPYARALHRYGAHAQLRAHRQSHRSAHARPGARGQAARARQAPERNGVHALHAEIQKVRPMGGEPQGRHAPHRGGAAHRKRRGSDRQGLHVPPRYGDGADDGNAHDAGGQLLCRHDRRGGRGGGANAHRAGRGDRRRRHRRQRRLQPFHDDHRGRRFVLCPARERI